MRRDEQRRDGERERETERERERKSERQRETENALLVVVCWHVARMCTIDIIWLHIAAIAELVAPACVFNCLAWRDGILARLFNFRLDVCFTCWYGSVTWSFVGIVCMLLKASG